MIPHDILTLYTAKMVEYGIAVIFLLLFIPFWRFVQGPAPALALAPARAASTLADWFSVPLDRLLHRGHAWALPQPSGLVTVGLDDFAANLVGPVARIALPEVGAQVGQGERAWDLVGNDGRTVAMLAPVDGEVAEINPEVAADPATAARDPYGAGWLMKVRPSRLRANRTNLLAGDAARRWMREVAAGLQGQLAPGLGALAQDGGAPVAGMARAIDADRWDDIARLYLLSADEEARHA